MTNQPMIPIVPDPDALGLDEPVVERDADGTPVGRGDLEEDIERSRDDDGRENR